MSSKVNSTDDNVSHTQLYSPAIKNDSLLLTRNRMRRRFSFDGRRRKRADHPSLRMRGSVWSGKDAVETAGETGVAIGERPRRD